MNSRNRFRAYRGEHLETRCLLNAAPVAVPDHYEAPQDTVLAAARPTGPDSILVDFNDGRILPHLEGSGFIVQDGVVRRSNPANHNDRQYLRTREAGFLDIDFRYEVSLTTSFVNKTVIHFVGIGTGGRESAYNEPDNSIHLSIHGPQTIDGWVAAGAHPPLQPSITVGYLREFGTHRIRLEKIGNTLTFSIDEHFDGQFVADISYTFDDLAAVAPFLRNSSTHLFFGTGIEEDYFDDFSVEFLTPAGVLANDTDADGDALTAELVTEPAHGSIDFQSDGTFTYTPQPGFVGVDSFTYRAHDGDEFSEPTEVQITVLSTNVPPTASGDFYRIVQDQTLTTTAAPTSELRSESIFFTNFDDGLPPEFSGTTTLADVQGYAGLGTDDNVFSGRMLRNQTGMAFDFLEEPFSPVIPTRLTLHNLPEHESVDIRFLLAAIDSWDGNSPLPDILAVTVDGQVVFVETLDGTDLADQSYEPPAGALLVHNADLGFNALFTDAAYDMSFDPRFHQIPHTSSSITIEWFTYGDGWTAAFREDESWGIDNVEVLVNSRVSSSLGVLANDFDPNGQPLSATVLSPPEHGQLALAADGSFTYTPEPGFVGVDAFSYRASDGLEESEPGWVVIEVRPDAAGVSARDDRYDVLPDTAFQAGQRVVISNLATGFREATGQKLSALAQDADYRIVASPDDLYTGQTAVVMPGEQPVGGFLPDSASADSRWISVLRAESNNFSVEPGEYVFETTVELAPEIAYQTAFIQNLRVAADNELIALTVNGVSVPARHVVGFGVFTELGDVGLGAFQPGLNFIRFHVLNHNGGRNPLGLRLEGQLVAQPRPAAGAHPGVLANDFFSPLAAAPPHVSVGATADLWLAGMPNGTQASFGDVAPAHSPTRVTGLTLRAGDILRFSATGSASNTHNLQAFPITGPDGGFFLDHASAAEHGLSNVFAPLNSLIGVFLTNSQPNFLAAPSTLDFRPGGNVPGGVNYTRLAPALKQVFFIGDGLTSSGQQQEIVVPAGATRLFLGTMDGFRWADNIGRYDVQIAVAGETVSAAGAALVTPPAHGQVQLDRDGRFTYTPAPGFTGVDTFTYRVTNSRGETDTATVELHVDNPGPSGLPGDYNGNNQVEQADLDLVLLNWGQPATPPPAGWINHLPTGTIDQAELDAVLLNWGATTATAQAATLVPLTSPPEVPLKSLTKSAVAAANKRLLFAPTEPATTDLLASSRRAANSAAIEAAVDQVFTHLEKAQILPQLDALAIKRGGRSVLR